MVVSGLTYHAENAVGSIMCTSISVGQETSDFHHLDALALRSKEADTCFEGAAFLECKKQSMLKPILLGWVEKSHASLSCEV